MTTLIVPPSIALDDDAHECISTFMTHVAAISDYGPNRIAMIAHIKTLLLAAIARGDGASSIAWSALYHAIAELVASADATHGTRDARDYLRSFIEENADLARD